MSKSVLVVNTPRKCIGCQFFGSTYYLHCILASGNIEDIESKPDWCPLKPLPEKMKLTGVYSREYFQSNGKMPSYKIGWNDCIDKIIGGNADD